MRWSAAMSIDLEARVLHQVREILRAHVPECEVWAVMK